MHHLFGLLLLSLLFSRAEALFGYELAHCLLNSSDGHDAVYVMQIYMNKELLAEYNSTVGKYIGYTERVKDFVAQLNKDKSVLKQEESNLERCKSLPKIFGSLNATVEPSVRLRAEPTEGKHMVICSAYSFYPRAITLSWLKNGQKVTSGVISTDVLPNGNWLYQVHSHLEYTPTAEERITCMVEHASFHEPRLYEWAPIPESQMNKYAVGSAGLLMGLVFLLAGVIYCKKKTAGHVSVPTVPPSSDLIASTTTSTI